MNIHVPQSIVHLLCFLLIFHWCFFSSPNDGFCRQKQLTCLIKWAGQMVLGNISWKVTLRGIVQLIQMGFLVLVRLAFMFWNFIFWSILSCSVLCWTHIVGITVTGNDGLSKFTKKYINVHVQREFNWWNHANVGCERLVTRPCFSDRLASHILHCWPYVCMYWLYSVLNFRQ